MNVAVLGHLSPCRFVVIRLTALVAATAIAGCGVFAAPAATLRLAVRTTAGDVNAFDPLTLEAPSHTLVTVDFTNVSALEHNLVFIAPITARTREIVEPGQSESIQFQTPGAGEYRFVCTIHEEMNGRLSVR
jgi:plastocyanin